jgi:hypothetical protein
MAYARGLFRYTLDEMDTFDASLSQCVVIPMHEHAELQPIFLQPATVPVDSIKPLAYNTYCWLLRMMCIDANLLGNYVPCSWRRGTLTQLMRLRGTEFAQEVARHRVGSRSIYYYNRQPVANQDILALLSSIPEQSSEDMAYAAAPAHTL